MKHNELDQVEQSTSVVENIKEIYDAIGIDRTKKQFVIVTTPVREKLFIVDYGTAETTNKHLITYTSKKEHATVFNSFKSAETFKDNINNPHERVFSLEYL